MTPDTSPDRPPRRAGGLARWVAVGVALLAAGGLWLLRAQARDARPTRVTTASVRLVAAAPAALGPEVLELTLPGSVRASQTAIMVAKTNGYVGKVSVDIGQKVKQGQLLATIDAQEVGDELAVSRARLEEARQNVEIARSNAQRRENLVKGGAVSQQEADDARGAYNSAQAAVGAGSADVQRLSALSRYTRITAPFAGTIIRRAVDPGAFAQSGQTVLFEIALVDTLEVGVDVPQAIAELIGVGTEVEVSSRASGKLVKARVARSAGALAATTRTLHVEIDLPPDSGLLAGSYVNVKLKAARSARPVRIPANALAVDKDGTAVYVIGADSRVQKKAIVISRDLGRELELASGEIQPGDRLVLSPPALLADGETVQILARAPDKAASVPPVPPSAAGTPAARVGNAPIKN